MSYSFFNPADSNNLANFQGTLGGSMAGNSAVTGVASAPTEIFNQSGYYAFKDNNTGYLTLQKLHNDSLYTNQWYSQGLKTTFDFNNSTPSVFNLTDLSTNMSAAEIAALDA